ncbi:zinc finger CCCH-type with G patch domain-containing protein [Diorhabda carinulata]|uniref:zinc finger CCCH-type with G patch domain-containing protein n=1 Tax=Diorhabda carinulata TaxID=1163345 RepID=UPI0025A2C009|nr:zinc finger CCCH-type with G patch domain-containing protein [Diorhabda carinulata]
MDLEEIKSYEQQLIQVNQALSKCLSGPSKEELLTLKSHLTELLELASGNTENSNNDSNEETLDDEFAAFMAEMEMEGAVQKKNEEVEVLEIDVNEIEGKKCRAPHQHQWGSVAYHNAMICSVDSNENEILKVRVLFTNPTHQEMLPCPFYYTSECKFSEEQCRFSHGEVVPYSSLQDYIEPNFEVLNTGSIVLAKKKDNLWYRAQIKRLYEQKCLVKFENDCKEAEINLEHIFPLFNETDENSDNEGESLGVVSNIEEVVNKSLMITPAKQALGEWEQYTKGIGSKLMSKMGYIVGTGLGKNAEGRVDPVSAFIFPAGKSLDHCMNLRELSGGDKDLFSVEKKLKRIQKRQEIQSRKNYERQEKQQNVFAFINKTVQGNEDKLKKSEIRETIKKETDRSLNIKSVTIDEDIRKIERDLEHIKTSLNRQKDTTSEVYKKLRDKLNQREIELVQCRKNAQMIKNEQSLRSNKKKMTVF